MKKSFELNATVVQNVCNAIRPGLCSGLGDPCPGHMCVEAAVAYAMGEPHTDQPKCVSAHVRDFKIGLNDQEGWLDNKDRAKGLMRVAIAQLGTKNKYFAGKKFLQKINFAIIQEYCDVIEYLKNDDALCDFITGAQEPEDVVEVLEAKNKYVTMVQGMLSDESEQINILISWLRGNYDYCSDCVTTVVDTAKSYKAKSRILHNIAELAVSVLEEMDAPGCEYLHLVK